MPNTIVHTTWKNKKSRFRIHCPSPYKKRRISR